MVTLPLGSKIKEDALHFMQAFICNDGTELAALVFLFDENALIGLLFTPEGTLLPAGIASSGQIGIAGQAKSALVDSGVVDFFAWAPLD